jgi:transposase
MVVAEGLNNKIKTAFKRAYGLRRKNTGIP